MSGAGACQQAMVAFDLDQIIGLDFGLREEQETIHVNSCFLAGCFGNTFLGRILL